MTPHLPRRRVSVEAKILPDGLILPRKGLCHGSFGDADGVIPGIHVNEVGTKKMSRTTREG